ncbi:hypothetical protein HY58_09925 [Flavihumibacter sp. ZG627]|nr:hypothetical protein HY58_09925 [Flavihumibacter sp. ZG627]
MSDHEKYEKKEQGIPWVVKQAFNKQYPTATARWEKEDGKYEANFNYLNHKMSVSFEENGNLIESEVEIKNAELPSSALKYIDDHFKGATIKESAKITKVNGEINYEAEVKGKDLIFDASGKFLKEIED